MAFYINTKRKVATPKSINAGITNAINLKFVKDRVESKEKIQAKEISETQKISSAKLWNVNCGLPQPGPYITINYKNNKPETKITFMSTWGVKCGIATYTSYLLNNINKLHGDEIVDVFPLNDKDNVYKIDNDIVHIQHEFGIIPKRIETDSKVIITFHAIPKSSKYIIKQLESTFNVVGYIAHSKVIEKTLNLYTKKDVHLIPHGSEIITLDKQYSTKASIRKELNFDKLGISENDKCAFAFGFQSADKNFNRVIEACRNTNIKLIISGAKHENEYINKLVSNDKKKVIFLNKFLNDTEINMYSSACDLLIFDYMPQKHYSCSGAMHRIIGSGNPVICSRINHFNDIIENEYCLKFDGQKELELKIKKSLEKSSEFSEKSLKYANETSWENVAKQHLSVYEKYTDVYKHNEYDNIDYKNKVVLVSSWGVKCGIALYTEDLFNNIKELYPNKFEVRSIKSSYNLNAKLLHFQHEFGIMPVPPKVSGKVVITWHTAGNFSGKNNMDATIEKLEKLNDVVAHIVTCEGAAEYIKTSKDVYVVNLGSKLMKPITKQEARSNLGINIKKPIGFIFGFQSANKNYLRMISAAKKTNIHLIICSSMHSCGYNATISNNEDITFVEKYLTDDEIDLYASASDILLFDYAKQSHYSSSSALHRTIGAGRPVVCHDTNHFNDIKDELDGALKFKNEKELENCIIKALKNKDELGNRALEYAKRTSREEIAKRHIEIYSKYINL